MAVTETFALFEQGTKISKDLPSWFSAMEFAARNDHGYFITDNTAHLNKGYEIRELST